MNLSLPRQQVARSLVSLETALARLTDALTHSDPSIDAEPTTDHRSPIRRICEAYSAIDYRMDDDTGSSVVCLAVLGVTADVVRRAEAVNDAKAEFKAICTPLQGIRIKIPVKGTSPTKAIPALRVILRAIQRSDVNLLAAYRKIPILDTRPATVTYTRANTRSVYRKSIQELYDLLGNMEGPAIAADRTRLASLDRRETHLALVKQRYQNIRANILYTRLDPRGRGRTQIAAELPLLYTKGRSAESPEVRFPAHAETPKPSRIRQSKLEPAPFLRSIPVYRYAR